MCIFFAFIAQAVRHEFLNILACLVRHFPECPAVRDLHKLGDKDLDVDFFTNVAHIQVKRPVNVTSTYPGGRGAFIVCYRIISVIITGKTFNISAARMLFLLLVLNPNGIVTFALQIPTPYSTTKEPMPYAASSSSSRPLQ